jgi:hypothetical protein
LWWVPLAITKAAAFISENHCTVADYLEALQASDSDEIELLNEDLPDPRRDLDAPSFVRTWKLSFDLLSTEAQAEMLSLAAVLDRQGIPKSLLRKDSDRTIDFTAALGTLQSFFLIKRTSLSLPLEVVSQINTEYTACQRDSRCDFSNCADSFSKTKLGHTQDAKKRNCDIKELLHLL